MRENGQKSSQPLKGRFELPRLFQYEQGELNEENDGETGEPAW